MQKTLIKLLSYWPLLIILFFALYLRLFNLKELFYFTYDESVFAFVARRLIIWQHVPLIGGVTPFGVHVAPYFYWFFTGLLFLGKLDPIVWGYFSAILGALTTLIIYLVVVNFLDKKTAMVSSTLWVFSSLTAIYDRHFWGLTFGPIFSLIILFFLKKLADGEKKYFIPLAVTLSLIIHADLSYLVFVVISIITWVIYKLPVKGLIFIFITILLFTLPLILFDIRHDFSNTRPFINYLKADKSNSRFDKQTAWDRTLIFGNAFSRFIIPTFDNEISKQYSYCSSFIKEKYRQVPKVFSLLSMISILAFIVFAIRSKNTGSKLIVLLVSIYFIGIQSYGFIVNGDIFEHYLTGLFPVFIIIFSFLLTRLPNLIWLIILAILLVFNLNKTLNLKNSHGLRDKHMAIDYAMSKIQNQDFSLESLSTCWRYSGYRYLFAVYGKEPVKSYVDPNFGYLYGETKIAAEHPERVVAFITHDFIPENDEFYKKYALFKFHEIESNIFGNIEVIIMDNNSKWF